MIQFTQGDWTINNWPQSNADICIGAVGTPLIARIPLRDVSINQQKANARLITASPDGYRLAKQLLAWDGENQIVALTEVLALARSIVSKVETDK